MITNHLKSILVLNLVLLLGACTTPKTYRDLLHEHQAIQEIERLHAQYFELMDAVQNQADNRPTPEEMIDTLFIKDGYIQAGQNLVFRGADGLPKFVEWLANGHKEGVYIKHYGTNTAITISGNTATSQQQMLMIRSDKKNVEGGWLTGHYINTFIRNSEGQWKFKSKLFQAENFLAWPAKNSKVEQKKESE